MQRRTRFVVFGLTSVSLGIFSLWVLIFNGPRIESVSPRSARAGVDIVTIVVRNMPPDPVFSYAGIPLKVRVDGEVVSTVLPNGSPRQGTLRIGKPNLFSLGPTEVELRVTSYDDTVKPETWSESLCRAGILPTTTCFYSHLFSAGFQTVTPSLYPPVQPFGEVKMLAVVGVPADIVPAFTFDELQAKLAADFEETRGFWAEATKHTTGSLGPVSISLEVYNQPVALEGLATEYIHTRRPPSVLSREVEPALGSSLFPFDALTNRILEVVVIGPDTNETVIDVELDRGKFGAAWLPLFFGRAEISARVVRPLPISSDTGPLRLSLAYFGPDSDDYAGYRIKEVRGEAAAMLGLDVLTPHPALESDGPEGSDKVLGEWESDLLASALEGGVDLDAFDTVTYVFVGQPGLTAYEAKSIPFHEQVAFRASAAVGLGFIRLSHINQAAVWSHEFGHNLGFLDQYETAASAVPLGEPIGAWNIMANHSANSHPTAFERHRIRQSRGEPPYFAGDQVAGPLHGQATKVKLKAYAQPRVTGPGKIARAFIARVSETHRLFAEVRVDQPEAYFDAQISSIDDDGGGVVVFLAADDPPNSERNIGLLTPADDALNVGEEVVDDVTGARLSVLSKTGEGASSVFEIEYAPPSCDETNEAYCHALARCTPRCDLANDCEVLGKTGACQSICGAGDTCSQGRCCRQNTCQTPLLLDVCAPGF